MAVCRCINFAHPEHAGQPCTEPATSDEGLCETCHEHDQEEMGTILRPVVSASIAIRANNWMSRFRGA
jgi:hypothetical protein